MGWFKSNQFKLFTSILNMKNHQNGNSGTYDVLFLAKPMRQIRIDPRFQKLRLDVKWPGSFGQVDPMTPGAASINTIQHKHDTSKINIKPSATTHPAMTCNDYMFQGNINIRQPHRGRSTCHSHIRRVDLHFSPLATSQGIFGTTKSHWTPQASKTSLSFTSDRRGRS